MAGAAAGVLPALAPLGVADAPLPEVLLLAALSDDDDPVLCVGVDCEPELVAVCDEGDDVDEPVAVELLSGLAAGVADEAEEGVVVAVEGLLVALVELAAGAGSVAAVGAGLAAVGAAAAIGVVSVLGVTDGWLTSVAVVAAGAAGATVAGVVDVTAVVAPSPPDSVVVAVVVLVMTGAVVTTGPAITTGVSGATTTACVVLATLVSATVSLAAAS